MDDIIDNQPLYRAYSVGDTEEVNALLKKGEFVIVREFKALYRAVFSPTSSFFAAELSAHKWKLDRNRLHYFIVNIFAPHVILITSDEHDMLSLHQKDGFITILKTTTLDNTTMAQLWRKQPKIAAFKRLDYDTFMARYAEEFASPMQSTDKTYDIQKREYIKRIATFYKEAEDIYNSTSKRVDLTMIINGFGDVLRYNTDPIIRSSRSQKPAIESIMQILGNYTPVLSQSPPPSPVVNPPPSVVEEVQLTTTTTATEKKKSTPQPSPSPPSSKPIVISRATTEVNPDKEAVLV